MKTLPQIGAPPRISEPEPLDEARQKEELEALRKRSEPAAAEAAPKAATKTKVPADPRAALESLERELRGRRPEKTMQQVSVWLPTGDHAKLLAIAKKYRVSMRDVIALALKPFIEAHDRGE